MAILYKKVVKFPASFQTGLVFPNLAFPIKTGSAQKSFLLILTCLDVCRDYQQETVPSFPTLNHLAAQDAQNREQEADEKEEKIHQKATITKQRRKRRRENTV